MTKFAEGTTVSVEKTMMEIQATLRRYQAKKFVYGEEDDRIGVLFEMHNRRVKFVMPLPKKDEARLTRSNQHGWQGEFSQQKYDQLIRQRYRALLLVIKAKLESVESGVESFEDAFMAQIMLPSGETVGEWMSPQIEQIYKTNQMPPLLTGGGR
jgi:hypothetical protein